MRALGFAACAAVLIAVAQLGEFNFLSGLDLFFAGFYGCMALRSLAYPGSR